MWGLSLSLTGFETLLGVLQLFHVYIKLLIWERLTVRLGVSLCAAGANTLKSLVLAGHPASRNFRLLL
ncbi:hypothetical protein Barb4_02830 [Bacteroidales bacterium Barb4]|nr:hypothetical protein Barb4_02830 [Bacteroidales bacterium Barb4]